MNWGAREKSSCSTQANVFGRAREKCSCSKILAWRLFSHASCAADQQPALQPCQLYAAGLERGRHCSHVSDATSLECLLSSLELQPEKLSPDASTCVQTSTDSPPTCQLCVAAGLLAP
eukprot:1158376-Pelagomonas_calceolata.AAC.5